MLIVQRLEWDSKYFGYEIGKIEIDVPEYFQPDELPVITKGFNLVYIFSMKPILVDNIDLVLADKKIQFVRKSELLQDDFNRITKYDHGLSDKLLNLAYESGKYSRFRTDTFFIRNEFQILYFEWIKNSVERCAADEVSVIAEADDLKGFITLSIKNNYAEIGLIAVNPIDRGQGYGSLLIKYAIDWAYKHDCHEIKVSTQDKNKSAIALYEKNGFALSNLTYIYHYRNK